MGLCSGFFFGRLGGDVGRRGILGIGVEEGVCLVRGDCQIMSIAGDGGLGITCDSNDLACCRSCAQLPLVEAMLVYGSVFVVCLFVRWIACE